MRVVTVDAPGGENAFRKSIFTGPADVIHDLAFAILNDRFANATRKIVEHLIPTDAFPFSFATLSRSFEWIKNSIGIGNLIQRRWSFGAVTSARSRILGVAFKLLNLAGVFVDVGQQPARRLAVETSRRHELI